jgi:hypothetical protein
MYYLRWIGCLPFVLITNILCWLTNPIACLFVVTRERTDTVKRNNKEVVTMDREYLIPLFYLWQTHDNAVDEYFWGVYTPKSWFKSVRELTEDRYKKSKWFRYVCRILWLTRNPAYGWTYKLFSVPMGKGFQYKGKIPLPFGFYNDVNIGWKSHSDFPRKMFASRILGIRRG